MCKTKRTNNKTEDNTDEKALFTHYAKYHPAELEIIGFANAYKVFFLEKPNLYKLDAAESFWITKLKASINIMKTFLPKVKWHEKKIMTET